MPLALAFAALRRTRRGARGRALGAALAVILAGLAAAPGWAAPPSSEQCMMCHADRSITRGDARSSSVHVDADTLAASAHAGLQCAQCHRDAASIPHPAGLAPVRCETCHGAVARQLEGSVHNGAAARRVACTTCHGTHDVRPAVRTDLSACRACHAQESADYESSVHAQALARGVSEAAACKDCHGPVHAILSHLDPRSSASHARLATTCARCHADRELMTRRQITIPEAYALYEKSVHGRSSDPRAATCSDCHGSHRLLRAGDPASSIHRSHLPETCGRCHAREARAYQIGVHGTALARGVTAAPVCTDCHGEHLIRGPRDPDSPVKPGAVTATCARCHEAQGIRETFGLPAGRLETYRDSFHGLASRGGSPAVADCASCHGHHDILPSSDPRSMVSPQRLPRTCGRCHPGAGEKFARGKVHVATASPDNPVLYWVRRLYLALIVATIGGMLVHNALDFGHQVRLQWRRQQAAAPVEAAREAPAWRAPRWFVRMTLGERIQHGLLALSFFVLVYTGFALKFPESWPFAWLARLERGYRWRSLIHRSAAVVMLGTVAAHVVYLFTRRGRGTLAALALRRRDLGEVAANLLYLVGLRREPPAFGRFGYVEKAEYWALVWGTFVMTATGFALWFENQSLRWLEKWMLDIATLVHYYEAWLAFLSIIVWHFYHTIFKPGVYPMNWTWITGRISEESLRHEYPAEWERLAREEAEADEEKEAEKEKGEPPPP